MSKDNALNAVDQFTEAGCQLVSPLPIFLGIYVATGGNPCNGCGYDVHGQCKARKELFPGQKLSSASAPASARRPYYGQPGLNHHTSHSSVSRPPSPKLIWNCSFCQTANRIEKDPLRCKTCGRSRG